MFILLERFILSWYSVGLILGLFFLINFRDPIAKLIGRISYRKGGVDLGPEQAKKPSTEDSDSLKQLLDEFEVTSINALQKKVSGHSKKLEETESQVQNVIDVLRYYVNKYLSLFLVQNSKYALLWFYNNGPATRKVFSQNFTLMTDVKNPDLEKNVIVNVLVQEAALEKTQDGTFKITPIGSSFLEYLGFIGRNS